MPTPLTHADPWAVIREVFSEQHAMQGVAGTGLERPEPGNMPSLDDLANNVTNARTDRELAVESREDEMEGIRSEVLDRIYKYTGYLNQITLLSSMLSGRTPENANPRVLQTLSECLQFVKPHPIEPGATTAALRQEADQKAWTSMFDDVSRLPEGYGLIDPYKESLQEIAALGAATIRSRPLLGAATGPNLYIGTELDTMIVPDDKNTSTRIWSEHDPVEGITPAAIADIRELQHMLAGLIHKSQEAVTKVLADLQPFKMVLRERQSKPKSIAGQAQSGAKTGDDDLGQPDLGHRATVGTDD